MMGRLIKYFLVSGNSNEGPLFSEALNTACTCACVPADPSYKESVEWGLTDYYCSSKIG